MDFWVVTLLLVATGSAVWWLRRRRLIQQQQRALPSPAIIKPLLQRLTPDAYREKPALTYLKLLPMVPFFRTKPEFQAQSLSWQLKMAEYRHYLSQNGVDAIYFVHGTFVGGDPLGVVKGLGGLMAKGESALVDKMMVAVKNNQNKVLGDIGNYTGKYIDLFRVGLGDLACQDFVWSSENHAAARLRGACELGLRIYQDRGQIPIKRRVMLWGHSHGGNVFALLSLLIGDGERSDSLRELAAELYSWEVMDKLTTLRDLRFDFMTFGMPPHYPWDLEHGGRLVNVINHRGQSAKAGRLRGIWHTLDGDYVQQLGVVGSDIIATTPTDRSLNKRMADLFAGGASFTTWHRGIVQKVRVPDFGKTILVDYQDDSQLMPNFITTFFGHGVYTRYEHILFHLGLCCDYFYGGEPMVT